MIEALLKNFLLFGRMTNLTNLIFYELFSFLFKTILLEVLQCLANLKIKVSPITFWSFSCWQSKREIGREREREIDRERENEEESK